MVRFAAWFKIYMHDLFTTNKSVCKNIKTTCKKKKKTRKNTEAISNTLDRKYITQIEFSSKQLRGFFLSMNRTLNGLDAKTPRLFIFWPQAQPEAKENNF